MVEAFNDEDVVAEADHVQEAEGVDDKDRRIEERQESQEDVWRREDASHQQQKEEEKKRLQEEKRRKKEEQPLQREEGKRREQEEQRLQREKEKRPEQAPRHLDPEEKKRREDERQKRIAVNRKEGKSDVELRQCNAAISREAGNPKYDWMQEAERTEKETKAERRAAALARAAEERANGAKRPPAAEAAVSRPAKTAKYRRSWATDSQSGSTAL